MKKAIALPIVLALILTTSCVTTPPVTQGRFIDAVVACHSNNDYSPTIVDNVRACLTGAMAGGYAKCLDLLPYTIDQVACVVMDLLNLRAAAMNSGDAQPGDEAIMRNGNAWLKDNRISRR